MYHCGMNVNISVLIRLLICVLIVNGNENFEIGFEYCGETFVSVTGWVLRFIN